MKQFAADLHIHTALSPCASEDMTPQAIVSAAIAKGLAMIGICDHNATGNLAATQEAAAGDITVIPGMEITTVEEIHVIGLFAYLEAAEAVGEDVRATLPGVGNALDRFGRQSLMNATGEILAVEEKMLAAASTFGLPEAVNLIREHGGLAVAAHVDRPSFSVFSQLGMLPADARFDAIELCATAAVSPHKTGFAAFGLPALVCSDSHFLSDVGRCCTVFEMLEPTFGEMALALKGIDGRRICSA